MADRGDNSPRLEVFVCFWVHHQKPGLISPFLYEGHHLGMPHALDVHAVYLENTETKRKAFLVGRKDIFLWFCKLAVIALGASSVTTHSFYSDFIGPLAAIVDVHRSW